MTKTYLELSQAVGAHKFYEVTVDGKKVSVRYGRIGTNGTSSEKEYASEEAAQKDADKKIAGKKKKGYAAAVQGVRKKRSITRRSIPSPPPTASTSNSVAASGSSTRRNTTPKSKAPNAPVLWKFNSGSAAFGIYIDEDFCWVGNQGGRVFKLNHDGEVVNQYQLPDGVKCIIADEDWIYVGCDNGNVYDLTGKVPRLAYEISENLDIYWLDINDGLLVVSDRGGYVTTINHEDEEQWAKKSIGIAGWMVRCDGSQIYHGHNRGVTCYDSESGEQIWDQSTRGAVLFGWRMGNTVLAASSSKALELFDATGNLLSTSVADRPVYSCASSKDNELIFGGDDSGFIYCFNKDGERLWKLATTCGSGYSMQYYEGKLYIVTTYGMLTCIDVSEGAITDSKAGKVAEITNIEAPKTVEIIQTDVLETATSDLEGIRLKCTKIGGKLRVRALSDGYKKDWNVQFPKNLRTENAEFIVKELRESAAGFYRVYGDIYKV